MADKDRDIEAAKAKLLEYETEDEFLGIRRGFKEEVLGGTKTKFHTFATAYGQLAEIVSTVPDHIFSSPLELNFNLTKNL